MPMDDVTAELQDRLSRALNIILYNLPMEDGGDDLNNIRRALSSIKNIDLNNISARRFTKPERIGCPPPVIVRLASTHDVNRVLRNWKLLAHGVQVAADRTRAQREVYSRLRKEADAFNSNSTGSKNRVRYVNGTPTLSISKS